MTDTITVHYFESLDEAQKYIIKTIKKDQPKSSWSKFFMTVQ